MNRWTLTALVSFLSLAASSPGFPSPGSSQARASRNLVQEQSPVLRADGGNLFEVLARFRGRTAMIADRTYTEFDESQRGIRYVERVVIRPADEKRAAAFDLSLLRIEGGLDAGTLLLKRKRYGLMAGSLFEYRDFRVHDPALARKNYFVVPMGAVFKLGRVLRVFDVYPKRPGLSLYRVSVDAKHLVVLDQLRLSEKGYLQSILSYGKLKLGSEALISPEQSWWTNNNQVRVHGRMQDAAAELTFTPRLPRSLPPGYGLSTIKTVYSPANSKKFLELAYTNGLDIRFLIQSRRLVVQKTAPSPRRREIALVALNVVVKRFRQGLSTQFWANHGDIEFLALTSGGGAGLPLILKSVLR